ncbi:WD repeat-containing protein 83 [Saitoella coloradoensis]
MRIPNKRVRSLDGHVGPIHAVTYNSNGSYCLTGGQDRKIILHNPTLGTQIKSYEAHGWEVLDIAVSADNSRFVSCGGDKTVFLWDVVQGRTVKRFSGHFARVNCVGFNEDASVVVSGSFDSTVRIWDVRSQMHKPIQILDEAKDSVSSLQVTRDSIITGSVDGKVRTYDLRKGQLRTDTMSAPVTSLQQTIDSGAVLVTTLDSTLRLLDTSQGTLLQSYKGHKNSEYRIQSCLGKNEEFVVSGSEDGNVYVWDLLEGGAVSKVTCHDGKVVSGVSFHPKENQMLTCGTDGTVTVWSD